MAKIIVGKDLNYAASKTSTTVLTAFTPDLLRAGAIGVYAIYNGTTGQNADGKSVLVGKTDTTEDTATVGAYVVQIDNAIADFKEFEIFVGTSTGAIKLATFQKGEFTWSESDYTVPVRQILHLGFNGSTGSFNLPTLANGDEATVLTREFSGEQNETNPKSYDGGKILSSTADYDLLLAILTAFNDREDADFVADFVADGTLADITDTGTNTMAFVKGSATVTLGSTGGLNLAAGEYLIIQNTQYSSNALVNTVVGTTAATEANGIVYKIVSYTDDATIVLDRPYTGEDKTLTTANIVTNKVIKKIGTIAEWGIRLVSNEDYKMISLAVQGVLEDATITKSVDPTMGSGTYDHILAMENEDLANRGAFNTLDATWNNPTPLAVSTSTYDVYFLNAVNKAASRKGFEAHSSEALSLAVAIPTSSSGDVDTYLEAIFANI